MPLFGSGSLPGNEKKKCPHCGITVKLKHLSWHKQECLDVIRRGR